MTAMTEKLVVESANATIATIGSDLFGQLTAIVVRDIGPDIAQHLDASDEPGILSPVSVEHEGKDRPGAMLVLTDRAIVAWKVGTIWKKRHQAVIQRQAIISIEEVGHRSAERDSLRITEDEGTWTLSFSSNKLLGEPRLALFIKEVLEGNITPVFEERPDRSDE